MSILQSKYYAHPGLYCIVGPQFIIGKYSKIKSALFHVLLDQRDPALCTPGNMLVLVKMH